jgi:hypothetical protein
MEAEGTRPSDGHEGKRIFLVIRSCLPSPLATVEVEGLCWRTDSQMQPGYSWRRTTIGSAPMARRAGTYASTSAAIARRMATAAKVSGSSQPLTQRSRLPSVQLEYARAPRIARMAAPGRNRVPPWTIDGWIEECIGSRELLRQLKSKLGSFRNLSPGESA